MLLAERQLRDVIRKILLENRNFNEGHADKLVKLIGSGDLNSITQALELGESIDMISRYFTDESDPYIWSDTFAEKIIFFHMICHKELAAKLREEIESKPYGSNMFGFVGCEPGGTTVEFPDMPDFCKISFRLRVPAPMRTQ